MAKEKTTELIVSDFKKYGINEVKANNINIAFISDKIEMQELVPEYTKMLVKDLDNKETGKSARILRLKMSKIRSAVKSTHKNEKAEALGLGRYVDSVKNDIVNELESMEADLMKIEKHQEILEKQRLQNLQDERVQELKLYVEDAEERDLSSMEEDVWEAYYSTAKTKFETKVAQEKKEEAEKLAEEKAEQEEKKRILKENEKLKKEAEAKAKKDKIETDKREKEERKRKAIEDAAKRFQAEKEAKAKREKEELEAKLKAKEEAEKLAKKKEEDRIAQEKRAEEEKKQAELSKGDTEKIKDLIKDLELLKIKYIFDSEVNKKMYEGVGTMLTKMTTQLETYKK